MSLITTESFGAFKRYIGTDAEINTTANRAAAISAFARAGYLMDAPASGSAFYPTDDPVHPDRNALSFVPSAATNEFSVLWIPTPTHGHALIFGFSVFVPSAYPDLSKLAYAPLSVFVGPQQIIHAARTTSILATYEAFSVFQDLRVRRGTAEPMSQRRLAKGGMSYLEVRVAPNSLRVWMDDALVLDETATLPMGGVLIQTSLFAGVSNGAPVGTYNRWAYGNFYALTEDQHAPNVRLGPTTRVIARRPVEDVSAEFLRPVSFPSNASVVAQNIGPDLPPNTLQTENIGSRDEYAVAADSTIHGALMVHGAVVKTIAGNLESSPHALRPWIRSGSGEGADSTTMEFVLKTLPLNVEMTCAATREDGTIFVAGKGPCVLYSQDGGETWAIGYNGAGATLALAMAVGPDGTVRVLLNAGTVLVCHGTSQPNDWQSEAGNANLSSYSYGHLAVSPDNTWVATVWSPNAGYQAANGFIKVGAGSWQQVVPVAGRVLSSVAWIEDRFVTTHEPISSVIVASSTTGLAGTWSPCTLNTTAAAGGTTIPGYKRNGEWVFPTIATASTFTVSVAETITASTASVTRYETPVTGAWVSNIPGSTGTATNANGLVLIPLYSGGVMLSNDGKNFSLVVDPKFATTDIFGAPCAHGNNFILPVRATGGRVFLLRTRATSRPLLNVDGYLMHSNVVALDPATGLPWTGPAAAAATIGMTLDI